MISFENAFGYGQHSLAGISGVAIFVENLSNELSNKEMFLPEIEQSLSDKFKNSGIKVYKKSEWINRAGGAYIKIKIISSKNIEKDNYAIYLNFEFYRTVMLMSNMLGENKLSTAETWSSGKLMSCEQKSINSCIYGGISELSDIFIEQYLTINELKPEKK
ncbi:MAG: hypothetical protein GTO02_08250 [Candidatus Dadabacteria bacterium]|nr:hypothetical protein [Candidatus Dadabacteria bacterium]